MDFTIFATRKWCICNGVCFVIPTNKYLYYPYNHFKIVHKRYRSETLNISGVVSNFQFYLFQLLLLLLFSFSIHFRSNENCSNSFAQCMFMRVNRHSVNMNCIKITVWCWMSNGKSKTVEYKMKTLKQIVGMRNMPNNHTSVCLVLNIKSVLQSPE